MANNASREWSLIRFAERCEDAASGLYGLRDRLLQFATPISSILSELFAISAALRQIHNGHGPRSYGPSFYRIDDDLALVFRSLGLTLDDIFNMFERSQTRSEITVWEDLNHRLEREEHLGLLERLETYKDFLEIQVDVLEDREDESPDQLRLVLTGLVATQQSLRGTTRARRTLHPNIDEDLVESANGGRTPRPAPIRRRSRSRSRPRPPRNRLRPPSTIASDDLTDHAQTRARPPAPDPPLAMPSLSPTETHFSSSSSRTRSSYTSYTTDVNSQGHWAPDVFNGNMPTTAYLAEHQQMHRCRCYGEEEDDALENLAHNGFERVAEVPFDEQRFWAIFFWRSADYSARLLLLSRDRHGHPLRYCASLKSIKVIRQGSCLLLCRINRQSGQLTQWARLNFLLHERMVLFSCTILAMKAQDPLPRAHRLLVDSFPL